MAAFEGGTIKTITVGSELEESVYAVVTIVDDMETGAPTRQVFRRFVDKGDRIGLALAMDLAERKTAFEFDEDEKVIWWVEDVTGEGDGER